MNRREFCRLGLGGVAAGAGVLAAGGTAGAMRPVRAAGIDPDKFAKRSIEVFLPGKKTCVEAILVAGAEALGIKSELIPDISLGLSGGIGRQGSVCGLVTGAALLISLAAAKKHSSYVKKRQISWDVTERFYKDFEKKFGSVLCRKLSGLDLTTPEGMKSLAGGVKKNVCGKITDAAARMLAERLDEIMKSA